MGTLNKARRHQSNDRDIFSALEGQQFGRYLIQRKLGAGGAATVYQAYDQVLGRTVALKILPPWADANALNRFQREATTAGLLHHPNIVRTLQVGLGKMGRAAYIAMELIEGESLAELLGRVGRLSAADSCRMLAPVADALDYAHAQGIVHRDVKPSNILLRPAQPQAPGSVELEETGDWVQPLLSDFGISRALDAPELTHVGRTVGTPAFMSPEQCSGSREVDGRADLYSLGAVLFRCVAGHAPYQGSMHEILHAHVYRALTIDADLLEGMPPSLVRLLQGSLAKDPLARFQAAGEMARLLRMVGGDGLFDLYGHAGGADFTQTLEAQSVAAPPRARTVLVAGSVDEPSGATESIHTGTDDTARTSDAARTRGSGATHTNAFLALMLASVILLGSLLVWSQGGLVGEDAASVWAALTRTGEGVGDEENRGEENRSAGNSGEENSGQSSALDIVPTPGDADALALGGAEEPLDLREVEPRGAVADEGAADGSIVSEGSLTEEAVVENSGASPTSAVENPVVEVPGVETPAADVHTDDLPGLQGESDALDDESAMDFEPDVSTPEVPTPEPPVREPDGDPADEITDEIADEVEVEDALPEDALPEVSVCPATVDSYFLRALADLSPQDQTLFRCPEGGTRRAGVLLQRFEHGTILHLDANPFIYVYYSHTGEWEQVGIPDEPIDLLPEEGSAEPGVDLRFLVLWQEPYRQAALGPALTSEAENSVALVQRFAAGMLIGEMVQNEVFILRRDRLRF